MKFGTAHGISRPEVGSTKRIDVHGSGGVLPALLCDRGILVKRDHPYDLFEAKTKLSLAYCL